MQSLKSLSKKEIHQTRRASDNQRSEKYFQNISKLPRASSLSQAKNSEIEYKWKEISKVSYYRYYHRMTRLGQGIFGTERMTKNYTRIGTCIN